MSGAANIKKCLLALLVAALLIWLYALIKMSLWQDNLQQKIAQFATSSPAQRHAEQTPIRPLNDSVTLSNIALPVLPSLPAKAELNQPAIAVTSMSPTQKVTETMPEKIINKVTKPITKPLNIATQPKSNMAPKPELPALQPSSKKITQQIAQQTTQPITPPAKLQSADEVYQQLQSDQSLDLQIALPANATQRNQLLNYLYQCAGMQFAILQKAQQGQQQQELNYLSPKRYVPVSQWLRVANGELSPQEQQWLTNQHGTAIRIFPQAIDQRLSHYLASTLQGAKLSSLRASYHLTAAGLVLSNIQLNQQNLNSTWQLHNSQCAV
ncbi:hypothetical protein [Paraglaciecola sp.]|uniref:hypothetical protein n=1 Tax=Paraglaciecola sp. TaxID=1920173 RepID=UPI0030F3B450